MSSSRGKVIRQYRMLPADDEGAAVYQDAAPALPEQYRAPVEGPASLLERAHAEAAQIITDANRQAERMLEQAINDGHRLGYEAGQAEGQEMVQQQLAQEIDQMQSLLESIRLQRSEILQRAERELVDLAVTIARKVVGEAIGGRVGIIHDMARQAIEQLGQAGPFRVQVNPEDYRRLSGPAGQSGTPDNWEFVSDERVAAGGCIVTCGAGSVDARPATQIDLIQDTLRGL